MKILVAVKRVIDFKVAVRLKSDGSAVETSNVKMSMNPFDEIALEEALRLKEAGFAVEVIVVSIGEGVVQETLRQGLAMGADRAIHVGAESVLEPLIIAQLLKKITEQEDAQIVFLGKQAIDSDDNQVGQMLAGLLNWAQGTFISKVICEPGALLVTREVDGGLETLRLTLPAVLTADLRLNEPRYISLPNIMQAKRKPLTTIAAESLSVDLTPRMKRLSLERANVTRAGKQLETVDALVQALKQDGVL